MKPHCKCAVIALNELKTQWRCFVLFFLISFILLSALISIFSMTKHIPDEMTGYVKQTGNGSITIDADISNFEKIEALPLEIVSYHFPYTGSEAINIPKEMKGEILLEDGTFALLDGSALRWLSDERSLRAEIIEEKLIEGRTVEAADNTRQAIWISDQAAKLLNVKCGDSIEFRATSEVAKSVSCEVAGIYRQDATIFAYYVTTPLYYASLDTVKDVRITVVPQNLRNFRNVVNDLQPLCLSVYYTTDFVDSVMMLVYTLYAICAFLCLLLMSIVLSISKGYFNKRSQFFAICKAIGIKNGSLLLIVCIVMQGLLVISFFTAMLVAPLLSRYIINFMEDLFGNIDIPTNVWTPLSFLLFFLVSFLLWTTCILSQKSYRSAHIVELIRQGNE